MIAARYLNNRLVLSIHRELLFKHLGYKFDSEILRINTCEIGIFEAKVLLDSVNEINREEDDRSITPRLRNLLRYTSFDKYVMLQRLGVNIQNGNLQINDMSLQLPNFLIKYIEEFTGSETRLSAFVKFLSRAFKNPIKSAAFSFIEYVIKKELPITPKGYILLYKSVKRLNNMYNDEIRDTIKDLYKARKKAKKGTKVEVKLTEGGLAIANKTNAEFPTYGILEDLYLDVIKDVVTYTDHHSGTTRVVLNKPFPIKPLPLTDNVNLISACEYGLHLGSEGYVRNFYTNHENSEILYCLVDPMLVINASSSMDKIRCRQYFPFSVVDKSKHSLTGDSWKIQERIIDFNIDTYEEIFDSEFLKNVTEQDILSELSSDFILAHVNPNSSEFKKIDNSLEERYGVDQNKMQQYFTNDTNNDDDDDYDDDDNTNDPYS